MVLPSLDALNNCRLQIGMDGYMEHDECGELCYWQDIFLPVAEALEEAHGALYPGSTCVCSVCQYVRGYDPTPR